MLDKQINDPISLMLPDDLIGRKVTLVACPHIVGQITAVHSYAAGRTYTVAWYDGGMCADNFDAFQLTLLE